jgi:hypothetical protein
VPLLEAFKAEQQPLAPTLGGFTIPRILCDVGDHPRVEDHLPIAGGIKAVLSQIFIAQFIRLCSASNLEEARRISSPLQG